MRYLGGFILAGNLLNVGRRFFLLLDIACFLLRFCLEESLWFDGATGEGSEGLGI